MKVGVRQRPLSGSSFSSCRSYRCCHRLRVPALSPPPPHVLASFCTPLPLQFLQLSLGGKLALAFGALMERLWQGDVGHVSPKLFKWQLAKFAPQFSGYAQQDSQELLAFLLDGLHEVGGRAGGLGACLLLVRSVWPGHFFGEAPFFLSHPPHELSSLLATSLPTTGPEPHQREAIRGGQGL